MLDELLDRLKSGGLTLTVIDLSDLQSSGDPNSPAAEASKLMDWIIANEKVLRRLYHLLESHGQPERAQRLKDWWTGLNQPLSDLGDEIPADRDGVDPAADLAMVQRIKDTAEPIVQCGRGVLAAIMERQMKAMTEVDFDDLIS